MERNKERNNKRIIYIIIACILLLIYLFVIIYYPTFARLFRIIYVTILLCLASVYDILESRIPLCLCIGVLLVNVLYAVFCEWDYLFWLASAAVILALMIIYVIDKKAIGLGDILILGFSTPALPFSNLLMFLLLTFVISSVLGLIKGIKTGKFAGTMIPLAPCMAFSFFVVALLDYL